MPQVIPMQFLLNSGESHVVVTSFTNIHRKKLILLQTTVNMCEIGHNNMTFTAVEQKIAWEYL